MGTGIQAHLSARAQGIVGLYEGLAPYRGGIVRLSAIRPSFLEHRPRRRRCCPRRAGRRRRRAPSRAVNQQTLTDDDRAGREVVGPAAR